MMAGSDAAEWKAEPGHARRNGGPEEDRVPEAQRLVRHHLEHGDKSGDDPDQTDDDVNRSCKATN